MRDVVGFVKKKEGKICLTEVGEIPRLEKNKIDRAKNKGNIHRHSIRNGCKNPIKHHPTGYLKKQDTIVSLKRHDRKGTQRKTKQSTTKYKNKRGKKSR